MTQKITVSDFTLHLLMKGKNTKLTRYMQDEIKSISKHRNMKRSMRNYIRNMVEDKSAMDSYSKLLRMVRGLADQDVIDNGYLNALKDDMDMSRKVDSLHTTFVKQHKKTISKYLRANNDCFMKNNEIVFRGSGSNAFALMLLHEKGYNIISNHPKSCSLNDVKQHKITKQLPAWKRKSDN